MRKNYIVFDLVTRKVLYETTDEESARNFTNENEYSHPVYVVELTLDDKYPCLRRLNGWAE